MLISSHGGIPIRYNFRRTSSETPGYHGHEALKTLLEGVTGVVWAAEPDCRETTLSRFSDYVADLQSTFSAMRELNSMRRILLLTRHSSHRLLGLAKENEEGRPTQRMWNLGLRTGIESLESTMDSEGLNCTVLRIGRYFKGSALCLWKKGE